MSTAEEHEQPGPPTEPAGSRTRRAVVAGSVTVVAAGVALAYVLGAGSSEEAGPRPGEDRPGTVAPTAPGEVATSTATPPVATDATTTGTVPPAATGSDPDDEPVATDEPGAGGTGVRAATSEEALALYVRGVDLGLSAPDDQGDANAAALQAVLDGALLEESLAQQAEYEANGWRQEGQTRVVSVEVLDEDEDRQELRVCLDASDVQVVDEAGVVVQPTGAREPRSAYVFVVARDDDDAWRVVERRFPDDPSC